MAQFSFKNLPDGFEFPITKREIRQFIKATPANFEKIEFAGISRSAKDYHEKHGLSWNWVCYLKADWRETEWVFTLEVNGLRPQSYAERRAEVSCAVINQIKRWAEGKLALSELAPKKSCRAHLYFDLTAEAESIATLTEWS